MRMKNGFLFSLLRSFTTAYEVHIKAMLKKVMLTTKKVKVMFLNKGIQNFPHNIESESCVTIKKVKMLFTM